MSLYGHEISDTINVFEAALDRWLKLDSPEKGDFIGRQALLNVRSSGGPARKLIALEMVDRGIARDGYPVLSLNGERMGEITSGSPAPFLKTNIAFALVPTEISVSGEDVLVQIRPHQTARARQVPSPFYKRPKP
jgi:aminomethyltransferase